MGSRVAEERRLIHKVINNKTQKRKNLTQSKRQNCGV